MIILPIQVTRTQNTPLILPIDMMTRNLEKNLVSFQKPEEMTHTGMWKTTGTYLVSLSS